MAITTESKVDAALAQLGDRKDILERALANSDYSNRTIAAALTRAGMEVSDRSVGRWRDRHYGIER